MDADSRSFGPTAREETAAAESALSAVVECAHLGQAMPVEQLGNAAQTHLNAASLKRLDHGPEKFGVEEHALYDFRDYGLD